MRSKSTDVGYQPVGMKPSTSLAPGFSISTRPRCCCRRWRRRSVLPSGEISSAFGVVPGGAFGKQRDRDLLACGSAGTIERPHLVGVRARDEEPRTVTRQRHGVGMLADDDLAVAPRASPDRAPALSRRPRARQRASSRPATSARCSGSAGRFDGAGDLTRSESIALTARPRTCTAYSVRPSADTASPPMKPVPPKSRRSAGSLVAGGRSVTLPPARNSPFAQSNDLTVFSAAPDEYSTLPSRFHASPSQAWSTGTLALHVHLPRVHDGQGRPRPAVVADDQMTAVRGGDHRHRKIPRRKTVTGGRDAPAVRQQGDAAAERPWARRWIGGSLRYRHDRQDDPDEQHRHDHAGKPAAVHQCNLSTRKHTSAAHQPRSRFVSAIHSRHRSDMPPSHAAASLIPAAALACRDDGVWA